MLAPILLSLSIVAGAPRAAGPAQSQKCIDPATPLQRLALEYDRWPAPQKGLATKAYAMFREAMESRRRVDYANALLKYHNLDGDQLMSTVPHVQLAVGVLYLTGHEFNFDGTENYRHGRPQYNTNAERAAGDLLPKLVANDPTQWLGAVALTRLAMQSRGEERWQQARTALQQVLAKDPSNVTAHLAWRDLLVAQDSVKEALAYLQAHAVDCVPVMAALAESMMITGDTAGGSRLYIKALEQAAPDELDRFYQDLLVMADREELKQYDKVEPAKRGAWIRTYWDRNAAAYDRTIETRVAEQTVRAAYADQNFVRERVQSTVLDKNYFVEDSAKSVPWDLRGVMYVRHGPPLHRMRWAGECTGFEGWVYVNDGDPWVIGFNRACDAKDWKLQQIPSCTSQSSTDYLGVSPAEEATMKKALEHPDSMTVREIYQVFARYDPRYSELARMCSIVAAGGTYKPLPLLQQEIAVDRRHLIDSVQWGGTAYRQFLNPVRMLAGTYAFRGTDGKPEVAVMTWMPVEDMATSFAGSNARATSLRMAYALMDSAGAPLRETTTVGVPAGGAGIMRTAFVLHPQMAGDLTLRVTVVDPADSTRGGSRASKVSVAGIASGLALSDIILAEPGSTGPLVRGEVRVAPLASHTITVGDSFRLFFEAYGLTEGQDFKQSVRIERTSKVGVREQMNIFPGRKDERTVAFDEKAHPDTRGVTIRDVEMAGDFVPGDYDVEVTMTVAGKRVSRKGVLHVVAPK